MIERVTGVAYHPGHVWRSLREQLANLCPDTIDAAADIADQGLNRIVSVSDRDLCHLFLRHTGLKL